ncbi:MAG TPA: tetratricopeptide repeat protein, partial [Bacteroidales bacterium]|nr:tetratricopeptide repeat protein [Bacteroidales bacterium]
RMVDTIYWTIKTNQLYKNDIMMLDMIATADWKRPFYFAAENSVAHCFNVDSFCILEGWIYKLLPVKADPADFIPGMGGVDGSGSYDLIINKFKWGNLADPHVYVDPESLNNSLRAKTNILRTAQALIGQKRYSDAIRLMDAYFQHFPESKFPYDMFDSPMAEMYYECGQPAKANQILLKITDIYNQDLDYYYSFSKEYREGFDKDIQQALGTIRHMSILAERFHQKALQTKIDSIFNIKIKSY